MDNHYEEFKVNLSKIELEFKKLIQSLASHNPNGLLKKTVDAKKVAIMIEKYLNESPNMLYEIITRNLGRTQISWDDLLKCLQDEFFLSYTVLKRESKKFSITEAKWNNGIQFKKIMESLKAKETNCIQMIFKPNLGFNISQVSSQCDILAVLLEKQLYFYLIQEDRIVYSMEFKYRDVKNKLLKKYQDRQIKKQIALRQTESLDFMPLRQRRKSFVDPIWGSSKMIRDSNKALQSENITQSAHSKLQHKSRMNSNASSQVSSFLRRYSTDAGVSDWKKKSSLLKKENSVKVKTNNTKKMFELFQDANLQNSIEIAKKFQQSRDMFQQFMILDKKLLQKEIKIQVEQVKIERKTMDFQAELQKMRLTSKNMPKYKKSNLMFGNPTEKRNQNEFFYKSLQKNKESKQTKHKSKQQGKVTQTDKSKHLFGQMYANEDEERYVDSGQNKLLENNIIGVVSYSFYQNFLLVSLFNREVRLYRIKKNLHRIKEELIFQKENDSLVVYVQIYRAIFAESYNMILCSNKNNEIPTVKIYEISHQTLFPSSPKQQFEKDQTLMRSQKSDREDFKEIFSCRLSFDPIYQNLSPLGIGAFNEKGYFALIETNNISGDETNKSEKKMFEKEFFNTLTGEIVSFTVCKAHANQINLYLVCKNGFIYLIDKITAKIKLQKKISQYKIVDITLIKSSTQILAVSEKGELMIINSQNLQQMYFYQTYMTLSQDSKLLPITQKKFIFYSSRNIRVIEIQQNEQKLLQYQKPLKIYRNRIKIKKQQALITKQTVQIQTKKLSISTALHFQPNQSPKALGYSVGAHELVRESKLEKFQSKFNKRKVKQFFAVNNTETPHYIVVLQNGEILVYDYKAEYFGSYLKSRHLEAKQCIMNKKMHYLGVLYTNSSIEVINLYSQICTIKLPVSSEDDQLDELSRPQSSINNFQQGEEILCIGFVNPPSPGSSLKQEAVNSVSDFVFYIEKSFVISVFNTKGYKTKTIDLNYQKVESSLLSSSSGRQVSNVVYWDKCGQLVIGNEKGQVMFYQRNTLLFHKAVKIAYYPIMSIQLLAKSSKIKNSKERIKYLLVLTGNNEIFLLNRDSKIFSKIYSPNKQLQQGKFIQKDTDPSLLEQKPHSINQQKNFFKENKNQKIEDQKISSIHYFSKIVSFSQMYVVYEWEEIYEKACHYDASNNLNFSQTFNLKKTLQSFVKSSSNSTGQQNAQNVEVKRHRKVGYLIERLKPLDLLFQGKMSSLVDMTKLNNSSNPFNSGFHFLKMWDTQSQANIQGKHQIDKKQLSRFQQSKPNSLDRNSSLLNPYQLYCFVETNRFTVLIEPQNQFHSSNSKPLSKNLSGQKSRNTSKITSSFISRKSSFESSNRESQQMGEKLLKFSRSLNQQSKQRSIIRIYDLEDFSGDKVKLGEDKQNQLKIVLEQQI